MRDSWDELVHPVEAAQEGGFAAAAGADDGGDGALGDVEGNVLDGVLLAVPDVEVGDLEGVAGGGRGGGAAGSTVRRARRRWPGRASGEGAISWVRSMAESGGVRL